MKKIKLTQGKYTLVDNEDFECLNQYKWCAHKTRGGLWTAEGYLGGKKLLKMHRIILGAKTGQEVDHINRNSLDNRRKNLRICTRRENLLNRRRFKNRKWGYKGVYKLYNGMYFAQISFNNKKIWLGNFEKAREAHQKILSFIHKKGIAKDIGSDIIDI